MGDMIKRVATDRIELFLDQRPSAVQTIRIETSTDLAAWATMTSIKNKSSVVNGLGLGRGNDVFGGESFRGKVFYRFDPAEFGLTYPFFLRYVDVEAGADVATSAVFMAFDAVDQANYAPVTVTGTAPNAATIADSVQLILPGVVALVLTNADTADLLFAGSSTGAERTLPAGETWNFEARYQQLFLRGDGATVDFILTFSLQF